MKKLLGSFQALSREEMSKVTGGKLACEDLPGGCGTTCTCPAGFQRKRCAGGYLTCGIPGDPDNNWDQSPCSNCFAGGS